MDADLIINAKWIVPIIPANTVLTDYAIVICDQRIVAIDKQAKVSGQYTAAQSVELEHHALIPGLVNAHGHSPMALFRGIADDIALKQWLEDRIWPLEGKYVSAKFVREGTQLAMAEMISGGTTCFADMYFYPEEVAKASLESQMRVQLATPVLDFPTQWAKDADEYIAKATQLHDDYRNSETVFTAFGPHAPYTVSDEPLLKIGALAEELEIPIHIHMHETAQEVADALESDGRRPLQRMADLGLISPRLVCVHATQLLESEMLQLAEQGAHVIHCPSSNLKLASGLCEVEKLRSNGVNVGLGTDGAASNNDLDMFGELQLAAMMGKAVAENPEAVPASTALEMATINSAKAMGLASEIGSLEPGKLADIAAVNLDSFSTIPINNVISHLAYAVQSHHVSHVWCGGNALLTDGELQTLDGSAIRQSAADWQNQFAEVN